MKTKSDLVKGILRKAESDLINAVNSYTRAAQFGGLPAKASYRLQKVGGAIFGMVH